VPKRSLRRRRKKKRKRRTVMPHLSKSSNLMTIPADEALARKRYKKHLEYKIQK
jgi:hypothetical protein